MDVKQIGFDEYRDALPSSGFEVFHQPDALAVLDDHTSAELNLFGTYKGQQPVGLLPVFVSDRSVGRTVFSPPISMGVPRLGPVIFPNSPKRSKWERINSELASGVIDALDADDRTTLFRMECPVGYDDPRPYSWNEFSVEPSFTYEIEVEDSSVEDVMAGFSRSLRRNMRRLEELDLSIETEGIDSALRIFDDVVEQFQAHGDRAPMSRGFLRELLTSLDDDRWRAYVARAPNGEYQSGIVTLYSAEAAYFWQGGVVATYDGVSVNTLLHRRILEDICTDPQLDSISRYDLVGANTERLCEYKGKFNGRLRPYYVVESSGFEMRVAKSVYGKIAGSIVKG